MIATRRRGRDDRSSITTQMIFDHLISDAVANAAGALACLRRRPTPADCIRFAGLFGARVEPVLALFGYLGSPYSTARRTVFADLSTPVAALLPADIETYAAVAVWRAIGDEPFRARFCAPGR